MAETGAADPAADRAVDLVRHGDHSTLTFKSIMATLQNEFGDGIRRRKSELRQLVNRTIEEMNANASDDNKSDAKPDSEQDSIPTRSISKRKSSTIRGSVKRRATGSGIQKAVRISVELAAFLGVEPDPDDDGARAKMARTEVTRRMIRYVKENSLQSTSDGRKIICDEPLAKLLGVTETTFFNIQKVLAPHFEKGASLPTSSKKQSTRSNSNDKSAFHKPYAMSRHLQAMLCTSEPMSRPQIVKSIWAYIKQNNLQNENDKRFILCDSAMKSVFKCSNLHMMKMNKILSDHLIPVEIDANQQSQSPASNDNVQHVAEEDELEQEDVKPTIKQESG